MNELAPGRRRTALCFRRIGIAGLAGVVLALNSCSLLRKSTTQTTTILRKIGGVEAAPPNPITLLQGEVMREADNYAAAVAQAADDFSAKVPVGEGRIPATQWKLHQATGAYHNATTDNPALGAVGMVILASLSRMVVEDYWVGQRFGAAAQPLLDTQRKLESNTWSLVNGILNTTQQQELKAIIADWRLKNPDPRSVETVRFREFLVALGEKTPAQQSKPGSLLQLVGVDPLGGLDPAVRAIEQTRYLAERAIYYVERMPTLVRWQAELLTFQLAVQPETKSVLADANRLSKSSESFAKLADDFPKLVNDERTAAIQQLLAGVASERSNILATLDAQEKQLRELLPEVRQTLAAGSDMGNSLNGAIKSLDAFVHYVSPPNTNPAPAATDTNSTPFNVLDYGKAATQVGVMAKDINTLLTSVNQSVPPLAKLSQQSAADAERVVHRAFWLGLVLIVVLLAGAVVAALIYRALARKLFHGPETKP